MKKINITVVSAGDECYPGCVDLLAAYPEIHIVARSSGFSEAGIRAALCRSDVLLLDEAVLEQDGYAAVRAIHENYPLLRSLLVLENESQQEMMTVLSLGILGVIRRESTTSQLCKAVSPFVRVRPGYHEKWCSHYSGDLVGTRAVPVCMRVFQTRQAGRSCIDRYLYEGKRVAITCRNG